MRIELLRLIRRLKQHGLRPVLFKQRERLDQWIADYADSRTIRCVVAAGGDGTVADLVNRHPGLPIAVLPLGTENLIARYLGLTRAGEVLANLIQANRQHRIDVGLAGERKFLLMAGVGIDGEVVHRVDAARTGPIRRSTYFRPIIQTIWNYSFPRLRIRTEDSHQPLEGCQVVSVNINRYAMGLQFGPAAIDHDGLLDVNVFHRAGRAATLRYLWHIRRGSHPRLQDVTTLRSAVVTIESDVPVPVQLDGDPAGWTPLELRMQPQAQPLIVPDDFPCAD